MSDSYGGGGGGGIERGSDAETSLYQEYSSPQQVVVTEEGALFPSSPFFADAMLDLDTAHDLAETPDASQFTRKTISEHELSAVMTDALALPSTTIADESSSSPARQRRNGSNNSNNNNVPDTSTPTTTATSTNTTTAADTDNNNTPEKHEMKRITNMDTTNLNAAGGRVSSLRRMRLLWSTLPKSRPTWPRDWLWALSFCITVPLALGGPLWFAKPHQNVWTSPPLSTATLGAWWVSAGAAALTTRWMYARRRLVQLPQGDDDHHHQQQYHHHQQQYQEDRSTRHERIAAGLVSFAAWSVVVYLILALTIFIRLPKARWTTLLPLAYTIRDVYLVRRWKQRRSVVMNFASPATLSSPASPSSSSSSSSYASRYAFFQALVAMALDILAQALRRASFLRVLTLILVTQTLFIGLWRRALINALDDESVGLLVLAAIGGKWATGTMARLLSLIASGGVVNWFVQQQELYQAEDNNNDQEQGGVGDLELVDTAMEDSQVPEAYRTVGASVYQSVLRMDDALEDDDEDEEEEFMQEVQQERHSSAFPSNSTHHHHSPTQASLTTVRGLLSAGLSVSFGSVAKCGLLGGPAQFVWSQIRKVDLLQQQQHGGLVAQQTLWEKLWNHILLSARSFAHNHSDLAMSHVAAYYKPYPRAARDVSRLIEEAGVEPVLHDDITTHMCSCVGGTISGVIVLLTGHFAQRHRVANGYADEATDLDVVKNMLLAFILSYTLIFTVMEPLRAAIKAVYVAFAQNPRSLSHAYPLIYHRLTRLSEANLDPSYPG